MTKRQNVEITPNGNRRIPLRTLARLVAMACLFSVVFSQEAMAIAAGGCPGPPPPYCPGPVKNTPLKNAFKTLKKAFSHLDAMVKQVFYTGKIPVPNLSQAFSSAGSGITQAVEVSIDANRALTQAKTDSWAIVHNAGIAAEAARDRAGTPERGNILCHTIAMRQIVPVMDQFAEIVSKATMSGFLTAGRGPGQDYDGPAYVNLDNRMTCGINPDDPVTGHPLDKRDAACTATEVPVLSPGEVKPINPENNPTGSLFADAGFSASTLDPEQTVLTMPEMKTGSITLPDGSKIPARYPHARPDSVSQKMWIAARDFCTRAGGPHPTPPWGKELDTPDGKRKSAAAARCLSMKMSFMKQCADRIGYITRPDCKNTAFAALCKKAKDVCTIALAHNITLPPRFQECKYGLSAYETEQVSHLLCSGSGRYINMRAQSVKAKDMDMMAEICAYSQATVQRKRMLEQEAFLQAMNGLQEMKSCWDEVR